MNLFERLKWFWRDRETQHQSGFFALLMCIVLMVALLLFGLTLGVLSEPGVMLLVIKLNIGFALIALQIATLFLVLDYRQWQDIVVFEPKILDMVMHNPGLFMHERAFVDGLGLKNVTGNFILLYPIVRRLKNRGFITDKYGQLEITDAGKKRLNTLVLP